MSTLATAVFRESDDEADLDYEASEGSSSEDEQKETEAKDVSDKNNLERDVDKLFEQMKSSSRQLDECPRQYAIVGIEEFAAEPKPNINKNEINEKKLNKNEININNIEVQNIDMIYSDLGRLTAEDYSKFFENLKSQKSICREKRTAAELWDFKDGNDVLKFKIQSRIENENKIKLINKIEIGESVFSEDVVAKALKEMELAEGVAERTVRYAGQEFKIKDTGKRKRPAASVSTSDPTSALSAELKLAPSVTAISKSKSDWMEYKSANLTAAETSEMAERGRDGYIHKKVFLSEIQEKEEIEKKKKTRKLLADQDARELKKGK